MMNLWESKSANLLTLADVVRELGTRPIECEADGIEVARAVEQAGAAVSAVAPALLRLKDHP